MDRRINVAKVELIGRQLAVGVHVPFAKKSTQLLLGKLGIELRERHHVKGQVPGGEPGILPFIGHRKHIAIEKVLPIGVAARFPLCRRRRRLFRIAVQPVVHDVVIELFVPQQPRKRLRAI